MTTTTLLQTKLQRPQLRCSLVARPGLVDRPAAGQNTCLTLIFASAGYGKTTLVTAWLQESRIRSVWLSLDESNNDPRRFLDYLLAALRNIQPDLGMVVDAMHQSPDPPLFEPMSEREIAILHLLSEGLSNQEIAERLFISVGTAKSHVHHILEKLDNESRLQTVAKARNLGFL